LKRLSLLTKTSLRIQTGTVSRKANNRNPRGFQIKASCQFPWSSVIKDLVDPQAGQGSPVVDLKRQGLKSFVVEKVEKAKE
jgi:hypothetical protein